MAQRYTVIASGSAKAALVHLLQKALSKDLHQEVLASAKTIIVRLEADPSGFGDPSHRLSALRLLVHTAIVAPLTVTYGVHEDKPLVFISEFKALSRYRLED
jgi:hypothetical protein